MIPWRVCQFPIAAKGKFCFDFTDNRCDAVPTAGRSLEAIDHHTRRKLFHVATQGHRGLTHVVYGGMVLIFPDAGSTTSDEGTWYGDV
jgi:hypothetical protein